MDIVSTQKQQLLIITAMATCVRFFHKEHSAKTAAVGLLQE